jgi:spermidine synthase
LSKIKRLYEPVTFSESNGILHLHFGTPWIQGAMKIKKPDELFLEYAQQMMGWLLFLDPNLPKFKCLQLGLGTGSITEIHTKTE